MAFLTMSSSARPRLAAALWNPRSPFLRAWALLRTFSTVKEIASVFTPVRNRLGPSMRRADRLFRIVQLLRSGRLVTARNLAQKLEVSPRTIYRDVQDLQLSGVPVEGEAGVGYTLRRDFDIPPLMFSRDEITAL